MTISRQPDLGNAKEKINKGARARLERWKMKKKEKEMAMLFELLNQTTPESILVLRNYRM